MAFGVIGIVVADSSDLRGWGMNFNKRLRLALEKFDEGNIVH